MQLIIDTATDNFADIEDATILLLGILSRNPDGVSLGALAVRAGLAGNDAFTPAAAFSGGSTPNAAFGAPVHSGDAADDGDDDDDGSVQAYVQLGGTLPPVATLPSAAAAPRPPATAGVELDADGVPWDANIHATGRGGSHPKTADGRWRKKRGATDTPPTQAAAAPVQAIPTVAAAAPAPAPVAAPAPPPAPGGETPAQAFARFMQDIKPMSASDPQFTPMLVGQVLPQIGLTNLIDLTKNPDKIPQLRAMLGLPA